jgi:hypothetical protein
LAELDHKGRRGELAYRVRGVQPIPGHGYEEGRVEVLSADAWIVTLDLDLLESVKGMTVKRTAIHSAWCATPPTSRPIRGASPWTASGPMARGG